MGSFIASWYISLAFIPSYRFLCSRTGGYPAKSPLGYLLASMVTQIIGMFLVFLMKSPLLISCILSLTSILIVLLSPANNAALHLSQVEI